LILASFCKIFFGQTFQFLFLFIQLFICRGSYANPFDDCKNWRAKPSIAFIAIGLNDILSAVSLSNRLLKKYLSVSIRDRFYRPAQTIE
jgi:hypothetical protein